MKKKAENVTEYIILLHGRFTGSVFLAAGGGTGDLLLRKSGRFNLRSNRLYSTQSGHSYSPFNGYQYGLTRIYSSCFPFT